ncbi:MAG: hypothetical protein GY802_15055, partial [Gammaproteobacteria bacterium]|nr:hypothetical protein [Gammaproteobacteria bacterium]
QQIAYSNSSDTPPASAQIDWTFDDGNASGQGSGGALDVVGSTTVTIAAVNDDPTNAGSLPSDIAVTQDASSNVDLSAIELSDVDAASSSLTVTLATSTGGDLTATSSGGVTVGGSGTGTMTLDGTVADLNTFLDTASNITYLHGTPGTNGDNADTIQINVNDNGNTGTGGGTNIDFGTANVDIASANTAPTDIVFADGVLTNDGATNEYMQVSNFNASGGTGNQITVEVSFASTTIPSGEVDFFSYAVNAEGSNEIILWMQPDGTIRGGFDLDGVSAFTFSSYDGTALFDGNQHQLSI